MCVPRAVSNTHLGTSLVCRVCSAGFPFMAFIFFCFGLFMPHTCFLVFLMLILCVLLNSFSILTEGVGDQVCFFFFNILKFFNWLFS